MTFFFLFFFSQFIWNKGNKLFTKAWGEKCVHTDLIKLQISSNSAASCFAALTLYFLAPSLVFLCLSRISVRVHLYGFQTAEQARQRASQPANEQTGERVAGGSGGRGRTSRPNRQRWHERASVSDSRLLLRCAFSRRRRRRCECCAAWQPEVFDPE